MMKMRKLSFVPLAAMVVGMLMSACSIKENRSGCPCRLFLDLTDVDTSLIEEVELRAISSDGFLLSERIASRDFGAAYMLEVPRRMMWLNALYAEGGVLVGEKGVTIPLGEECPPLYMWVSYLNTDCEGLWDRVVMRKNHCVISIYVEDSENFGFSLAVSGNVNGYSVNGRPSPGEFRVVARVDEKGLCRICVPRQMDASLTLELHDDTKVQKSFALGEYVIESGYDWAAPDLEDLTVGIDYSLTKIALSVQGWDREYVFDMEL